MTRNNKLVTVLSSKAVQGVPTNPELINDGVIQNSGQAIMVNLGGTTFNASSDGSNASTVRPLLRMNTLESGSQYQLIINNLVGSTGEPRISIFNGTYLVENTPLIDNITIDFTYSGSQFFISFNGTKVFNITLDISIKKK